MSVIGIAVAGARPCPDSQNSGNSNEDLSVRTLCGNKTQMKKLVLIGLVAGGLVFSTRWLFCEARRMRRALAN